MKGSTLSTIPIPLLRTLKEFSINSWIFSFVVIFWNNFIIRCTCECLADTAALPVPTQVQHNMTLKGLYICCITHKPNISYNFDSDLKQFIIKYEHFGTRTITLTKNKISVQQKIAESDCQHMNYGLKSMP